MKIFIKYILITTSLLFLYIFGCKDNLTGPSTDKTFYPINIDNTWNYNYVTYDSLGNLIHKDTVKEYISKTRTKDVSLVYEFDSPLNPPSPGAYAFTFYLQNKNDGMHFLTSSDPTGWWMYDRLLYKYPCNLNDIFINGTNIYDTTYVVSLNDTVNCKAGTFSCVVYKNLAKFYFADDNPPKVVGYIYTYVAYGVGKVKYESYRIDSKQKYYKAIEYSLINYNLN